MSIKSLCNESTTDKSLRDLWNTSQLAFQDAQAVTRLSFGLDACATDAKASKCARFITPEQDSLLTDWKPLQASKAVWCNPPFSRKLEFLKHGFIQSVLHKTPVVFMLPAEFCSQWFRKYVSQSASKIFVPDGRYSYLEPETLVDMKAVNFASCFVLFDSSRKDRVEYVEFERGIGEL